MMHEHRRTSQAVLLESQVNKTHMLRTTSLQILVVWMGTGMTDLLSGNPALLVHEVQPMCQHVSAHLRIPLPHQQLHNTGSQALAAILPATYSYFMLLLTTDLHNEAYSVRVATNWLSGATFT